MVVIAPSQRWISAVVAARAQIARGSGRTRALGRGTVVAGGMRVVRIASPPRSGSGVGGGEPSGPAATLLVEDGALYVEDGAPKSTRRAANSGGRRRPGMARAAGAGQDGEPAAGRAAPTEGEGDTHPSRHSSQGAASPQGDAGCAAPRGAARAGYR